MRFLILAAALTVTASPALGQFRPELSQWAEQGNASDQTRLELIYDLDWDVPHNDTEAGGWKPILIGAGIGLTVGFAIGWVNDRGSNLDCIVSHVDGSCLPGDFWDKPLAITITGSLVGAGVGAALGWLIWRFGEPFPD